MADLSDFMYDLSHTAQLLSLRTPNPTLQLPSVDTSTETYILVMWGPTGPIYFIFCRLFNEDFYLPLYTSE